MKLMLPFAWDSPAAARFLVKSPARRVRMLLRNYPVLSGRTPCVPTPVTFVFFEGRKLFWAVREPPLRNSCSSAIVWGAVPFLCNPRSGPEGDCPEITGAPLRRFGTVPFYPYPISTSRFWNPCLSARVAERLFGPVVVAARAFARAFAVVGRARYGPAR